MTAAILLVVADSLYGTIRATGTGETVPGVRVNVRGRSETVVSDSVGLYVLRDMPGGRIEIRFERLGFEPMTVSVMLANEGPGRVDVDLAPVPVALPPVTVVPLDPTAVPPEADAREIGRVRVTPNLAAHNPLIGESEVFEAIATAPFINGRDELAPSLHVRGGDGDENLVLLDGLPWRGPRPLGGIAGLLPNGAVASVDVHTAAPPARYGDALSSMIVVHPWTAHSLTAVGSMDGSMIEQTVGGPLPLRGASIVLSGRWTYRSVFNRPEGGEGENGFRDEVGRLSLPTGPGSLDLYYVDGRDRLSFPATPEPSFTAMNHFTQAGSLAGAVWTGPLGAGRTGHARLWSGTVTGDAAWGTRSLTSSLRDVGVSADYAGERTEAGLSLSRAATSYRVQDATLSPFALHGAPVVVAVFASRVWTPASSWTVSTGLRLSATSSWGVQIEPRLWTRASLGHGVSAALGYARMHQYVQSVRNEESALDAVLAADLPVAAGAAGLPPARTDQLTAALEVRLGSRSAIQVEAYTRRLSGLALVAPATRLPFAGAEGDIIVGRGSMQGADAIATYQGGRLDVRAQVGLLGGYRTAGLIRYRPSDDVERATVGVGYRLSRSTAVRLVAHVGEGRPTTMLQDGFQLDPYSPLDGAGALAGSPAAMPGPLNGARLPAYARVDLGFSRNWELPPGGGAARINTSLTITNLFDHRNVLAYVMTPDGPHPVFLIPRTVLLRVRWSLGRPD